MGFNSEYQCSADISIEIHRKIDRKPQKIENRAKNEKSAGGFLLYDCYGSTALISRGKPQNKVP